MTFSHPLARGASIFTATMALEKHITYSPSSPRSNSTPTPTITRNHLSKSYVRLHANILPIPAKRPTF